VKFTEIENSHLRTEDAKQRRSGRIHRSMENNHLPAEGVETSREGQVDFTKKLRTATYNLKV